MMMLIYLWHDECVDLRDDDGDDDDYLPRISLIEVVHKWKELV